MVPPSSDRITRVPPYLMRRFCCFVYGAITLYRQTFQTVPLQQIRSAGPRSLAATKGISFDFFSSGYLDVSVPRVRLVNLCIQLTIPSKLGGFPHSEIPGSKSVYRLPEAYRRLPRPSSPVAAKAFTVCAYSLDHITPSSLKFLQKTDTKIISRCT